MAVQLNKIIPDVLPCYFIDEDGVFSTLRRVPLKEDGTVELVDTNYELMKIQYEWVVAIDVKTGEEKTDLSDFDMAAVEKVLEGKQKQHKGHTFRKTNLYKERLNHV